MFLIPARKGFGFAILGALMYLSPSCAKGLTQDLEIFLCSVNKHRLSCVGDPSLSSSLRRAKKLPNEN